MKIVDRTIAVWMLTLYYLFCGVFAFHFSPLQKKTLFGFSSPEKADNSKTSRNKSNSHSRRKIHTQPHALPSFYLNIFNNGARIPPPTPATTTTTTPEKVEVDETETTTVVTTPKITSIQTIDELSRFVMEDDRLCIVIFHASWCKSCQKFDAKFRKLARSVADQMSYNQVVHQRGGVRLAEVEYTKSAVLCRTLQVKKLPYVHFYVRGQGLVRDFVCPPKKFHSLIDQMNELLPLASSTGTTDGDGDSDSHSDIRDKSRTNDSIFHTLEAGTEMMDRHLPSRPSQ